MKQMLSKRCVVPALFTLFVLFAVPMLIPAANAMTDREEMELAASGKIPSRKTKAVSDGYATKPLPSDTLFLNGWSPTIGQYLDYGSDILIPINIDRYFGHKQDLIASGALPDHADLTLYVWDVDEDTIPGKPEVDNVYFNGTYIGTLTGHNNQWKANPFKVPIELVNLPSSENTKAENVIRIEIDTYTKYEWCVQIDWASLSIPAAPPVVLAHGIHDSSEGIADLKREIEKLGLPVHAFDFRQHGNSSIKSGGKQLKEEIQKAREKWKVDKVQIVAHSMGGLKAREYTTRYDKKGETVERVIQIATPNGGSSFATAQRIADIVGSLASLGLVHFHLWLEDFTGPAFSDLTPRNMANYNKDNKLNPNVDYTVIAGECTGWSSPLLSWTWALMNWGLMNYLEFGKGDGIVSVESAHTMVPAHPQSPLRALSATHSGLVIGADKGGMVSTTVACLKNKLVEDTTRTCAKKQLKPQKNSRKNRASSAQSLEGSSPLAIICGTQTAPGVTSIPFTIRKGRAAVIHLYVEQNDVSSMFLVSPLGSQYSKTEGGVLIVNNGYVRTILLDEPTRGNWTLNFMPSGSSLREYLVQIQEIDSGIELNPSLASEVVCVGNTFSISMQPKVDGTVQTGLNCSVIVQNPDNTSLTYFLRHTGNGVYSGSIPAPIEGRYSILPQVVISGVSYVGTLSGTAHSSTAIIGQDMGSGPVDEDGNGMYDWLVAKVGIAGADASKAYRVLAELVDADGEHIEWASGTAEAGAAVAELYFNGSLIFDYGKTAKYVITDVRLFEMGDDWEVQTDARSNWLELDGKTWAKFDHALVSVTGTGTDTVEWLDGKETGTLTVGLDVNFDVTVAGAYNFSASLRASDGTLISSSYGTTTLTSSVSEGIGTARIAITFSGADIVTAETAGPWVVTDVLLWNSNHELAPEGEYETRAWAVADFVDARPIWKFDIINGGAIVTGVANGIGCVEIPDTLGGHPVTGIGASAFGNCPELVSVTVPASVTNLGAYCFANTNLVSVRFLGNAPLATNTCFARGLLGYCTKGTTGWTSESEDEAWGARWNGIRMYPIPKGDIETLRGKDYRYEIVDGIVWVFVVTNGEASLEFKPRQSGGWGGEACIPWGVEGEVVVPSSLGGCPVTRIGSEALCSGSYTSVVIPHTVGVIAGDAFCYNGSQLKSVTIPNSVTNIGVAVFECSSGLEEILVESGNPCYESDGGVLYTLGKGSLVEAPPALAGHFDVPGTVTNIERAAFCSCDVTTITIPDSVISIGGSAFYWCYDLARIEVPASWYGASGKLAGTGMPSGCEVVYRGISPLAVATETLPAGTAGTAYRAVLAATGGVGPYVWSVAVAPHAETSVASTYAAAGTAQGWQADDSCWNLALPFAFPYFGHSYTNAKVNSNGAISFGTGSFTAYAYSAETFKSAPIIAVLWKDLLTTGGDIHVASGADAVTVRWAGTYYNGGEVNFSATLHRSGKIVLSYGAGNAAGGVVGLSAGDGVTTVFSTKSNGGSMANTQDIVFTPGAGLPSWLALSVGGKLTGTPPAAGEYRVPVAVTDSKGVTAGKEFTLAVSKPRQVTTFNGNGGTPATQKMTNEVGEVYGTMPTPKWSGYVFLGWFTQPEGGKQVTAADTVTTAAARTLYAHWTNRQVTTFAGNGGTPATQKRTNVIATAYGELPVPKQAGHAFLGWFTGVSGGNRVTEASLVTLEATRTLYAHWTAKQVTAFNGNGGTPASQKTTNTISTAYGTLPAVAWSNHVFLGWYTEATGGKRVYTDSTVTAASSRTLYAHWTNKQATTFNGNGGTPEVQVRTNTMGKAYGTLPKPAWPNHVFLGWYTTAKGGELVTVESLVTVAKTRTLYAHWTAKQVTTFKGNGGTPESQKTTNTIAKAFGKLPTATWAGHAFLGWYTEAEGGTRLSTNTPVKAVAERTFYAHWTDKQVTTFKGNGGTPKSQKTTNTIAKAFGTLPTATWARHAFLGWYTEAAGGTRVSTNTPVKAVAERTLYAQWTDKQVTTFNGNGGTPTSRKTTNTISMAYGTLPAVAWSNHVFLGWYTEATGGKRVYTNSTVTAASSRTLYAHWTAKQATTFNGNGGTPEVQVRTNTMGKAYGKLPKAAWPNHVFLGWFTTAKGGELVTTNSLVTVAKSRTLYAHWTAKQVTTFNGNGGTPEVQVRTNTMGKAYGTLPKAAWPNHVFLGWYTTAKGGELVTTNSLVTVAKSRTLYAHWTAKQVTTFNGNGGTPEVQVRTNTMGKAYGTLPKAAWPNHVFLGWYTTAKGGELVTTNSLVTVAKSRTLYAHWTAKQVTTFNGNGGTPEVQVWTNTMGKAYGKLPKVVWSNHVFRGWYTTAKGGELVTAESLVTVAKSRTLYAHWTAKQVTTFNGNGGTPEVQVWTNTMGKAYGKLPKVVWSNHVFLGWYTTAKGGELVTTNSLVTVAKFRTLYAHWTAKQVTTFLGQGGAPEVQVWTNTMGKAFGKLPTAAWAGHAFLGWYTAAEGGTRLSTNTPVKAVAERTFYAHWADKQVTTFKGNGGSPKSQKTTNTIAMAFGTLPTATWAGHAFLGWYTAAEGGTRLSVNTPVKAEAERTFYAHWTDKQVTTFLGQGGEPEVQMWTNTIGKVYGKLPKVTWSNHVFLGWYSMAKGGELVTTNSLVTVAKSRTLYAHWTDKQVTTFDGNGGAPKSQKTTNTIAKAFGKLPTATWAGHAFLGWYTAAEGGTRLSTNTPVKAVAERTFYAHWTDKQVTTFKGNGGTPKSQKTTNTIAMAFGTLPTATWAGHAFLGWYTAAEGGTRLSVNTPVKAVAERTFYAHWKPSKTIGEGFAITGLQVTESGSPAGSKAQERMSRGETCTIRFDVVAGVEYEIQWTPSLLAGWISLERMVAEDDGAAEVEVDLPAGAPLGFFRILSSGWSADGEN